MKSRGLVAALAFVFAAAAALSVYLYVKGLDEGAANPEMVSVVVAKQDIPAGADLGDLADGGAFTTEFVPEDAMVGGAVTQLDRLAGRKTVTPVLAGEQIPTARLEGTNELPGGVLGIAEGHQATTVDVESQRILGGEVVSPGDNLTIFATFDDVQVTAGRMPRGLTGSDEASFSTTTVVAGSVKVLGVSAVATDQGTGSATTQSGSGTQLTLELKPAEAQRLVFGQELGKIWVSLIPPGEEAPELGPISFGHLLGLGGGR